jgi:hypothetical protein
METELVGSGSGSGGAEPGLPPPPLPVWAVAVGPAVVTVLVVAAALAAGQRGSAQQQPPQRDVPWMWITRGLYFFDGFSTAFWSPLGATILVHDCGLSPSSVGLVMAITQVASIPMPTAITNCADRTRRHTAVFRVIILLPILVSVALMYEIWHVRTKSLLVLVGLTLVAQSVAGGAGITPMISGATMTRLSALGTPERFGRFMVFRALGWSSGSALAGVVYQLGLHVHIGSVLVDVPGAPAVVLCGLIGCRGLQLLLAMQVSLPSPGDSGASEQADATTTSESSSGEAGREAGRETLRSFLLNPEVVMFFCCMAINGAQSFSINSFLSN